MELEVKTLNTDGSVVFEGKLNPLQVQFILGVGINFLLANGAQVLEDDDDEEETQNAPSTDVVQ